jgi:hypothetical protein
MRVEMLKDITESWDPITVAAFLRVRHGIRVGHLTDALDRMGVHKLTRSELRQTNVGDRSDSEYDVAKPAAEFSVCETSRWDAETMQISFPHGSGATPYSPPKRWCSADDSEDESVDSDGGYGGDEFFEEDNSPELRSLAGGKPKMMRLLGL